MLFSCSNTYCVVYTMSKVAQLANKAMAQRAKQAAAVAAPAPVATSGADRQARINAVQEQAAARMKAEMQRRQARMKAYQQQQFRRDREYEIPIGNRYYVVQPPPPLLAPAAAAAASSSSSSSSPSPSPSPATSISSSNTTTTPTTTTTTMPLTHADMAGIHKAISVLLEETSTHFVQYPLKYDTSTEQLQLVDAFQPHANAVQHAREWQALTVPGRGQRTKPSNTGARDELFSMLILEHVTRPLRVHVTAPQYMASGVWGVVHRCVVEDTDTGQSWPLVIKEQVIENNVDMSLLPATLGYVESNVNAACPPDSVQSALNAAPVRLGEQWYVEPIAMHTARESMPTEAAKQMIPEIYGSLVVTESCKDDAGRSCRLVSVLLMEEVQHAKTLTACKVSGAMLHVIAQVVGAVQHLRKTLCLRNYDMHSSNILVSADNKAAYILDLSYVTMFLPDRNMWLKCKMVVDALQDYGLENNNAWMRRADLYLLCKYLEQQNRSRSTVIIQFVNVMKLYSLLPDSMVTTRLGQDGYDEIINMFGDETIATVRAMFP